MGSAGIGEPTVVVGLDFGTTFSGFAYSHRSNPNEVRKCVQWPDQGSNLAYCKTETSLNYQRAGDGETAESLYHCTDWGWSASKRHSSDVEAAAKAKRRNKGGPNAILQTGVYITGFKLHLAGTENIRDSKVGPVTAAPLPPGITASRAITDYLAYMLTFIITLLQQQHGSHLTVEEVQWCLTVPAIWDDTAKLKMKICAEKAGLVKGYHTPKDVVASPYPLNIVLEPEAAAHYCWSHAPYKELDVQREDHLLVADIGGGTVDIVVHEKASDGWDLSVTEVDASSGGLCGGSYVDQSFFKFIGQRIECLEDHLSSNPWAMVQLRKKWHDIKSSFDGSSNLPSVIDLPKSLASAWKKYEDYKEYNDEGERESYEELELSNQDMTDIFAPCVDEIIRLINEKMTARVKILMIVGGFSNSPYLKKRLEGAFAYRVKCVINPPDPGSAIAQGAVLMGLAKRASSAAASLSHGSARQFCQDRCDYQILSRVARKTYGIKITTLFRDGFHHGLKKWKSDNGIVMCNDLFDAFVCKGESLDTEGHRITREYGMPNAFATWITISVFSTDAIRPNLPVYTTDAGVTCIGNFTMEVADGIALGASRKILVTMKFGASIIEVTGRRINFGSGAVESFRFGPE